jgi:hypothetical protein
MSSSYESNRKFAIFIPQNKISAFKVLYDYLLKHYGTIAELEKALKIGQNNANKLFKDKKLTEYHAKKILNKFNEVKKLKKPKE